MVNQTPISVRLDNVILCEVDQEAMIGLETRNRILNQGARMYVDVNEMRRKYEATQDKATKKKIIRRLLMRYFPEAL